MLVAANHYLALPGLQYNLVPIDIYHLTNDGDSVTVSVTIETKLVQDGNQYYFQSHTRQSDQGFIGCPLYT